MSSEGFLGTNGLHEGGYAYIIKLYVKCYQKKQSIFFLIQNNSNNLYRSNLTDASDTHKNISSIQCKYSRFVDTVNMSNHIFNSYIYIGIFFKLMINHFCVLWTS